MRVVPFRRSAVITGQHRGCRRLCSHRKNSFLVIIFKMLNDVRTRWKAGIIPGIPGFS